MKMETIIVSNVEQWNSVVPKLKDAARINTDPNIYHVGFDTEYMVLSNYPEHRDRFANQRLDKVGLCTIQIACSTVCIIVRVHEFVFLPRSLVDIITSENWIKTGVGIDNDLRLCFENFELRGVPAYIDLRVRAILRGVRTPNLEFLTSEYLGRPYQKFISSVRDWTLPLTDETCLYITEDAYYSYALGRACLGMTGDPVPCPMMTIVESALPENYISRLLEFIPPGSTVEYGFQRTETGIECTCTLGCSGVGMVGTGLGPSKAQAKQEASMFVIREYVHWRLSSDS
jgi:hypothetical protein